MKIRFGSGFKGSPLSLRFRRDLRQVWMANFHPCVSGILPRPDLHESGVDSASNLESRGGTPPNGLWTGPLTQKTAMKPGSFFLDKPPL